MSANIDVYSRQSIYRAAVSDEELEAGKLDGDSRADALPGNDG